jgi:hypothetical protein
MTPVTSFLDPPLVRFADYLEAESKLYCMRADRDGCFFTEGVSQVFKEAVVICREAKSPRAAFASLCFLQRVAEGQHRHERSMVTSGRFVASATILGEFRRKLPHVRRHGVP